MTERKAQDRITERKAQDRITDRKAQDMGVSLKKGTTWGGRIQRPITNLLYTPVKKYLLYPDC